MSNTSPADVSDVTLTNANKASGQQHHRGRRLRNFVLPDGKEVHIALSPEEAESLRQRLSKVRGQDQPFDLVINGSPEHLEALRTTLSHHEGRRDALRMKHGNDFDEFENVRAELDHLESELHMLTDHAVSLDANFSKYGYRQYFHKGLLWRASENTEVQSFELFIDLLYVGILAINGDHAADDPTGFELLRFCITFLMSWKIWGDITILISWFETDDILQRLAVIFIMANLLGLTTNMLDAFISTYAQLIAFYMAARIFMVGYCVCLAGVIPIVRPMMLTQAAVAFLPCILWIGSIYISMPNRLAIIWTAIFLDFSGSSFIIFFIRGSKNISKKLGERIEMLYEFYPAVNIEHKVERTNAFVTLVFGYSVVAIIYQNAASFGLNAFFGKAVLGLFQAFCFNWIYFELDGADLYAHAIRRHIVSAMAWSISHVPFIMSFVLAAGSLSKLVIATDCSDTKLEDLTETYADSSTRNVPDGLRWFYCVGLCIALFSMGMISLCHVHKESSGSRIRIRKKYRLINRFAVCVILCCLPLVRSLNSLQLISTTTGLVVWVLLLELWGMSCPGESFFGEKRACKYTARCKISKKDLESAVKGGHVLQVKQLTDSGEKGMYQLT